MTEADLVEPLTDAIAHLAGSSATVAHAWLAEEGPGLFLPGASDPADLAGFGVARSDRDAADGLAAPRGRAPAPLGARTLERAVAAAPASSPGTRTFTDAVLALLPEKRTDVELFKEAWA